MEGAQLRHNDRFSHMYRQQARQQLIQQCEGFLSYGEEHHE